MQPPLCLLARPEATTEFHPALESSHKGLPAFVLIKTAQWDAARENTLSPFLFLYSWLRRGRVLSCLKRAQVFTEVETMSPDTIHIKKTTTKKHKICDRDKVWIGCFYKVQPFLFNKLPWDKHRLDPNKDREIKPTWHHQACRVLAFKSQILGQALSSRAAKTHCEAKPFAAVMEKKKQIAFLFFQHACWGFYTSYTPVSLLHLGRRKAGIYFERRQTWICQNRKSQDWLCNCSLVFFLLWTPCS